MNSLDFAFVAVLLLSVLLGLMRGGVKEVLSLAAWVLAFIAAKTFADTAAVFMPAFITTPAIRYLAGLVLVFIGVMALMMLLTMLLAESLKAMGLGLFDRLLGLLFGAIRGFLVVTTLVLLAGLTALPKILLWQQSLLIPVFIKLATIVMPWLPDSLIQHIHF
jgi:membrane protein required for colicin V production